MAVSDTTAERCALHDERYAKGAKCPRCEAVRRVAAITVADGPGDSEALDAEMLKDIEADLSSARTWKRIAHDRIEDGNPNDWNAATKLIAESTKLKYRALDQKDKLSARAHSRYLVEHEKAIRGIAKKKGN